MTQSSLRIALALAALTSASLAQSPVYTSGPDYMGWPTDTPGSLVKLVAADVTQDDLDDAFALHGTELFLVHAPAAFPRWTPVATGVSDFAVARLDDIEAGGETGALYAANDGLWFAYWQDGGVTKLPLDGADELASATMLCAFHEDDGSIVVAGKVAPTRVARGRLTASGSWQPLGAISEPELVSALTLADFTSDAAPEIATLSGGVLRVRSESGSLQPISGLPTEIGAKLFRLAGGGAGGRDSLAYVTASSQPGSLQALYEVFPDGVSLPVQTGEFSIAAVERTSPWSSGKSAVIVQTANTGDVFRFEDSGAQPGTQTLVLPTTTVPDQAYWWIPVNAVQGSGAPILDGRLTCGDFDADGLDDVLVASGGERFSYLFPAVDDPFRINGIFLIDRPAVPPAGDPDGRGRGPGPTDVTTMAVGIEFTIQEYPRGFTAPIGVNTVQCIAWVREGGAGTFVAPTPVFVGRQPANLTGANTFWFDVSTNVATGSTLVYVEVRGLHVQGSTVVQASTPVNTVTVLDGSTYQNGVLCNVFDVEPDMYSAENRSLNGCGGGGSGDGPVILGGFNRRSSIGPFSSGSSSPGG